MEHITSAFDPEATQTLCVAFDKVCSTIAERDRSEFVKELIARRVIALAERGERDPHKLAAATNLVESRCGAVALGCTYLLPPLSSGGALVV
jgi:hypothetical protein